MSSRSAWPQGLRIVFWVTVLGSLISTGQLIYFFFGPFYGLEHLNTFLGVFAFLDYALLLAALWAGFLGRRKLFGILVLLGSILGAAVAIWLDIEPLRFAFPTILAAPFSPASYADLISWYSFWNAIEIGTDALLIFYICYYELPRFRSHAETP